MSQQRVTQQDTELTDTLIAISVISKRLATKIKEEQHHEPDEAHRTID